MHLLAAATPVNNTVIVSGGNSLWNIGNNLSIGGTALEGNNWLQVLEGASVTVGNDMELVNGSTLDIGTNSTVFRFRKLPSG